MLLGQDDKLDGSSRFPSALFSREFLTVNSLQEELQWQQKQQIRITNHTKNILIPTNLHAYIPQKPSAVAQQTGRNEHKQQGNSALTHMGLLHSGSSSEDTGTHQELS